MEISVSLPIVTKFHSSVDQRRNFPDIVISVRRPFPALQEYGKYSHIILSERASRMGVVAVEPSLT